MPKHSRVVHFESNLLSYRHTPLFLCEFGLVLQRAFTCKERSVLLGSFTDTGVYGFGDQRVNPEGVLMQTCALV